MDSNMVVKLVGGQLTKYWELCTKSLINHLPQDEIMRPWRGRSILYNSSPIAGLKIKLLLKELLMYVDDMIIVVNYWMGLPKAKQQKKGNKSYPRWKTAISDPLMKTKFRFFATTAKILNNFLVKFQTNNLMLPFLTQTIEEIMRLFGSSFFLKELLNKANTCLHLSKLNSMIILYISIQVMLTQESVLNLNFQC